MYWKAFLFVDRINCSESLWIIKKEYILLNVGGVSLCGVRMIEIPLEVSIPQSFATCLKGFAMTWYQTIKVPVTNHLDVSWHRTTVSILNVDRSYSLFFEIVYQRTRRPRALPGRKKAVKNFVASPEVGLSPVPSYCS